MSASNRRPQITMKFDGANDLVIVDGHRFDRSLMTPSERHTLRRMIVQALTQQTTQKAA